MLENKIEDLLNSIQEEQNRDIVKVIKDTNLLLFAEEYLRKTGNPYAIRSRILQVQQKNRYKVFLAAIEEFLKECDKYGLRPVFMKGIFLAADLYEKIEKRPSHDIDIIIKLEEFPMYYKVINDLGYQFEYYNKDRDNYEFYYWELQQRHLGYYKDMNGTTVGIELHSAVVNSTSLFQNTADEFIDTAVKKELLGLTPYVLDPEHNLIQLALHFYKHLTLEYFQNMIFKREFSVNLINIHDIALYRNKYLGSIDEDKLLQIAKKMKVVKYIKFVFEFVNKLYGELFRTEFLDVLAENAAYSQIDYHNSERNGFGKLVWLLDIYVDYCKDMTIKQLVLGEMPNQFSLFNVAIPDPTRLLNVKDGEETRIEEKFTFPMKINSKEALVDVTMDISMDHEFLKIDYYVNNKPCVFYKEQTDVCYKDDGIEIIIIKNHSLIHRMFTVSNLQNQTSMVMYSNNTEEIIDISKTEVKTELDIHKNDFTFHLLIPWSSLEIDPSADKIVPFNIAGLVSSPDKLTQERACMLFNKDDLIWNFKDINGIRFE